MLIQFEHINSLDIRYFQEQMQGNEWEQIGEFKVSKKICLGKGQSCEVYYGFNMKTGQKTAAKKIDIRKLNSKLQKQLENEIRNLKDLKSPFIVRLLGYCRCGDYLYLFLEYCEDLDLRRYLEKNKEKEGLCEAETLMFMRYIIEGYKELYNNNIIHRDIKPANILLKQGIAKLSDFGFSRVVQNPDFSQKLTLLGTPLYTAPQILRGDKLSSKCDVWSVGIVFYEMLYGRTPWTGDNIQDLRQNILKKPLQFGQIKRKQELKFLIKRMLTVDSKERINWKQIFDNELFRDQLPKYLMAEGKGYSEYTNIFIEYVKLNIVKSYLRFNMTEVNFKEEMEPNAGQSELIKSIQKRITHKRNVAFMYAYILVLYYKNIKLLPPQCNLHMQFEYALVRKAFLKIGKLGSEYFYKDPQDYPPEVWKIYKNSASYEELKRVLTSDFKILEKMENKIKAQANRRFMEQRIPKQVTLWFQEISNNFDQGFTRSLTTNYNQITSASKKGVSGLLAYYIEALLSNPASFEQNQMLDFGSFYEQRQRAYGLA